jgi:metal-responsive CopG/Arc/MetJ family transcriptional regulator
MGQRPLEPAKRGEAPMIGVRLVPAELQRLDEVARQRGVNRSSAVRQAIAAWLDDDEAATG